MQRAVCIRAAVGSPARFFNRPSLLPPGGLGTAGRPERSAGCVAANSLCGHSATSASRPAIRLVCGFSRHYFSVPQFSGQRLPRSATHSTMASALAGDVFYLDEFAIRQWDDPNYSGTRINFDKAEFVKRVHQLYEEGGSQLVEGYAPFCKHVIVPNFVGAKVGCLAITNDNRHLLKCGYTRRKPDELAVLTRWFSESDVEVPDAKMLDVILYSRDQILSEYKAMQERKGLSEEEVMKNIPDAPWGIISIKAQDENFETPMQPITMLRNALGKAEGGSGVPLDRQKYEDSTSYWQDHAAIVAGDTPSGE